jgi:hypothetical protein
VAGVLPVIGASMPELDPGELAGGPMRFAGLTPRLVTYAPADLDPGGVA